MTKEISVPKTIHERGFERVDLDAAVKEGGLPDHLQERRQTFYLWSACNVFKNRRMAPLAVFFWLQEDDSLT